VFTSGQHVARQHVACVSATRIRLYPATDWQQTSNNYSVDGNKQHVAGKLHVRQCMPKSTAVSSEQTEYNIADGSQRCKQSTCPCCIDLSTDIVTHTHTQTQTDRQTDRQTEAARHQELQLVRWQ